MKRVESCSITPGLPLTAADDITVYFSCGKGWRSLAWLVTVMLEVLEVAAGVGVVLPPATESNFLYLSTTWGFSFIQDCRISSPVM